MKSSVVRGVRAGDQHLSQHHQLTSGGRMPLVVFTPKSRVFRCRLNATDVTTSLGRETCAEAARGKQKKSNGGRKDHLALPLSPPAVAAAGSCLPSLRLSPPPPPSPPQQDRPDRPWRGNQTFCQRRGSDGLIKGG